MGNATNIAYRLHQPIVEEVLHQLQEYVRSYPNIVPCTCEQCLLDIAALALKQLPHKYATTSRGECLIRVELQSRQAQLDIFRAIQDSIAQVKRNPRHRYS